MPQLKKRTDEDLQGLIFNIQRFSLHDGPGIRTTVFLKGCPLRCAWCTNPESQTARVEIMNDDKKCIRCGRCMGECRSGAITMVAGGKKIDRQKCDLCLKCTEVCPTNSLDAVGQFISSSEVLREIEKDRLFYLNSGGGVTFSGGEPLFQGEFLDQVLKKCKESQLHVTLDTSGHVSWNIFERMLENVDLVLYDLKHPDSDKHREKTGVGNELILENASKVATKRTTWFRIPFIPNFNDSPDCMEKVIKLALRFGIEKISLLPYHQWGISKYEKLGRPYPFDQKEKMAEEKVQEFSYRIRKEGLEVTLGA